MNAETDATLLRRYAENGDEAAFTEIVRRQVNLVYSASLRLVGGQTQLAEEVTQSVFTELARQAGTLANRSTMTGWLHTTARYQASKAIRAERRRRAREQEAYLMQNDLPGAVITWEHLQPILDEAVGSLSEADRDAVMLRFFEGKSHAAAGAILGLSEDSTRKRAERAVEKLRAYFARKGVPVSAGLLGEAISANSVQAAPAELAAGVTSAALANAVAAGSAAAIPFILSMTTKTKIILTGAVVLLAVLVATNLLTSPGNHSTGETKGLTVQSPAPANKSARATVPAPSPKVEVPKISAVQTGGNISTPTVAVPVETSAKVPLNPAQKPGDIIQAMSVEYDANGRMIIDFGDIALTPGVPGSIVLPTGQTGTMTASLTGDGLMRIDIKVGPGYTGWAVGDPPKAGESAVLDRVGWSGRYENDTKEYRVIYSAHFLGN